MSTARIICEWSFVNKDNVELQKKIRFREDNRHRLQLISNDPTFWSRNGRIIAQNTSWKQLKWRFNVASIRLCVLIAKDSVWN